jgi:hypothetical protein
MNWKTNFILGVVMVGLLSAGICVAGPGIGQQAPAFTLKDSANVNHSLSDYSGKVVMLNFWASW